LNPSSIRSGCPNNQRDLIMTRKVKHE
jgi:hypothetical protein